MPKKIKVNESQEKTLRLPKFIYNAIKGKYTSLGDNPAIPEYGEFGFEYEIVKDKFSGLDNMMDVFIHEGVIENKDYDHLVTRLSKLMRVCHEKEEKYKPQLLKLCENIVNKTLAIPADTVLLKLDLVNTIKPKNKMRIMPEEGDGTTYSFEDVDEMELTNKVIKKRRFVNSLIQGFSVFLSDKVLSVMNEWHDEVMKLDGDLLTLWTDIMGISDYLLYLKEEKISDDASMQNSYVEVHLGKNWKKTIINAQAILFPFLLKETFKGFFELFSSHGLPDDNEKAMYVIRKADFIVAEPWDMRLGVPIVDRMVKIMKEYGLDISNETTKIPYLFTKLCEIPTDEFNDVVKNILSSTKKGKNIVLMMNAEIEHDKEYQMFKDRIQQKNIDNSLLMDDCFTSDELDDYVLSENQEDEATGYHGTAADFERFNHRYFLDTGSGSQTFGWGSYITNDEGIAKGYADSARRNTMNYTELWNFIRDFLKDNYNYIRLGRAATYIIRNLEYYSWDELLVYIEKNCLSTKLSEDEVEAYLSALRAYESIREKVYIYEVDIPEDKGYNYIDWFNPILPRQAEMIMRGLRSLRPSLLNMMAKNNELFSEFYDNYINKAYNDDASFEESIELVCYESKFGDFTGRYDADYPKGSILYHILRRHTGSPKAASLFLAHCGFDGIKYKAGTIYGLDNASTKQPMNYVIFDANAIEIIEKKSV